MARKARDHKAEYARLKARAKAEGISVSKYRRRRKEANAAKRVYSSQKNRFYDPSKSSRYTPEETERYLSAAGAVEISRADAARHRWDKPHRKQFLSNLERLTVDVTGEYTRDEFRERYSDN